MKRLRQIFPSRLPILAAGSVALLCFPLLSQAAFFQTNLVSDIPGVAAYTDPNLVNPWGISFSSTGPFWISDNHTGVSTVYNGQGVASPLVVTVPPPTGGSPPSAPTGQVFNGSNTSFLLAPNQPARFIFATEDGTISGWNPNTNPTNAILEVTTPGAVYKGLAIGNNGSGDFLYAANFTSGTIDVFDSSFSPTSPSGSFTDPTLPTGYKPFNIQRIGNELFVTYALPNPSNPGDDLPGPGNGYVSVFDLNGTFERRLMHGDELNAPWGLALAPADFGAFSNDLLVGNFGDGKINAFDPLSGTLLGQLLDPQGNAIVIDGLWGLQVGNGVNGGATDKVYFTAGPDDETHGLFGSLSVPEPGSLALMSGVLAVWLPRWRNSRTKPTRRQVA